MKFVLVFLAVACALATARFSYGPNVAPQNPVPIKPLQQVALPDHFDWRNEAHLTDIQNQRLPNWCGSCWAVAATSSISDRFRIHYKKQFGYRRLSSQAVLNCAYEHRMGSCTGGDWDRAHNFILQHGLTDETCMPYQGMDRSFNINIKVPCADAMCRLCDMNGNCKVITNPKRYFISGWDFVNGTQPMMNEIYQRGPITCYIFTHLPAFSDYTGGIIIDRTPMAPNNYTHVVSLLGWGVENGVNYWIGRNSVGTAWGEDGFFRIIRGINSLNLEWKCGYAIPQAP